MSFGAARNGSTAFSAAIKPMMTVIFIRRVPIISGSGL